MNAEQLMTQTATGEKRRTTTEEVFRKLKADIISMRLEPGAKLSEVEVAKLCDVSRQPVREAFMRLGEMNLLQIVPQKATRVRKISQSELNNSRFIRAAVEVEVVRNACQIATEESLSRIRENLDLQVAAVEECDPALLHGLDYQFHKLICAAADRQAAFKTISENKAHTNRVCTLELQDAQGMSEVLEGHTAIFQAICKRDARLAEEVTRAHLSHLDGTLIRVAESYPHFFEE